MFKIFLILQQQKIFLTPKNARKLYFLNYVKIRKLFALFLVKNYFSFRKLRTFGTFKRIQEFFDMLKFDF